ncbi:MULTISPECIES: hypothetical protein [Protofrankia]|uniref:Uncharacterized protein n=1 Tax=Protofrankia coriariae TaxID=1562887 RepID=A0ABR5F3P5_9ACTN|nr:MULTISPECIES: hypothetical protein [Protofrankia]KLL11253.1 hypothetical protein FrCorBMG51_12595 [Protofrankia coriariae]ONH35870.1 hypothetical protein BL254_09550 [Protofrankia sp. BMG5.30]
MVISVIVQVGLGLIVFAVGWWGRHNAEVLVPVRPFDDNRERRVRVARRGAVACQVVGVLLALTNLLLLF